MPGDELYFNANIVGFGLTTTDRVILNYESLQLGDCDCFAMVQFVPASGMELTENCPGFNWKWQSSSDNSNWLDVVGSDGLQVLGISELTCNSYYRVLLEKSECDNYITNSDFYICF